MFHFDISRQVRSADTCDDVFALGIDQELAIELVFASGGIAGKRDAGPRVVAHVAKYHRLHINGCPKKPRDIFHLAILDRSGLHPAFEDRFDGKFQLFDGILRKWLAKVLFEDILVFFAKLDHAFRRAHRCRFQLCNVS